MRVLIILFFLITSCSPSKVNQTINKKKEGLWISDFETDSVKYLTTGKFKNDNEIGTWRFFENKKLVRKNKYKKNFCVKTCYHPNGKVASQGKTKTDVSDKTLHWYYSGVWKFYDEKRKLIETKFYEKGILVSSTKQ